MKRKPIIERIREAFQPGERSLDYVELAHRVFPMDQNRGSWRRASHGGPPGCYMALSRAIREHNLRVFYEGRQMHIRRPKEPRT